MTIGLDLDGTLLDSKARHVEALRRAAAEFDTSIPEQLASAYLEIKRGGINGRQALDQLGVSRSREIASRWIDLIESPDLLRLDCPYPNTLDELQKVSSEGHSLILVTSRQDATTAAEQIVGFGFDRFLMEFLVVDLRDRSRTKASATRQFRLEVIAGDTEVDQQWAIESRARFYASAYGFRSREFWARHNVDSYDDVSELLHSITNCISLR